MRYCLTFFLAFHSAVSIPEDDNVNVKVTETILKRKLPCKWIKCPPVEEPICVNLTDVKHTDKTDSTNDTYIILLNKCELEYVKCREDNKVEVVAMKNCSHGNSVTLFGRNTGKDRWLRSQDIYSDAEFEPKQKSSEQAVTSVADDPLNAAKDSNRLDNEDDSPIFSAEFRINVTDEESDAKELDTTGGSPAPEIEIKTTVAYEQTDNNPASVQTETNTDDDLKFQIKINEDKPTGEMSVEIVQTIDNRDEGDGNKQDDLNGKINDEQSDRETVKDEVNGRPDTTDVQEVNAMGPENDDYYHFNINVEDEPSKNDGKTQLADDRVYSNGFPVDYDLNSNNAVNYDEYSKDCPSVCPARAVMVCARCKDRIYRTFLSVCHLRMFNCRHPDEKVELVSRHPCVLSAPFLAEAPFPKGRLSEPGDKDLVLQFIQCRGKGKDDPRCNFSSKRRRN